MSARITTTALASIVAEQGNQITQILALLTGAQFSTPAPVAEAVTATPRKAAPAKATTTKGVKVVSIATATKLAAAGEDPWAIKVKSTNGNVIPFGKILRAQRTAARVDAGLPVVTAETKASNKDLAAWLRTNKLPANGDVWTAAKTGERNVAKLRKLA